MLRAALYELDILQRHFVFGGRIEARIVWRGVGHKSWRRLCLCLRGRDSKLFVPIGAKVKRSGVVQSCENGLRRKLCWRLRLKRWVRLRSGCVRYRRFLYDWICRGAA